jgi:hypothetical protein
VLETFFLRHTHQAEEREGSLTNEEGPERERVEEEKKRKKIRFRFQSPLKLHPSPHPSPILRPGSSLADWIITLV